MASTLAAGYQRSLLRSRTFGRLPHLAHLDHSVAHLHMLVQSSTSEKRLGTLAADKRLGCVLRKLICHGIKLCVCFSVNNIRAYW